MIEDDDNEGPFEEIAPGVEVRAVSDEYAARAMGITPEELRERLEGIANGTEKTYTLDEVIARFRRDDPDFDKKMEAERQRMRRRYQ